MAEGDENVATKSDTAWTPQMVFWNTVGTIIGGAAGLVALVIVLLDHF